MLGVQPVADERLAGERFGLGDLIFVMREYEIDAAGVDVERLAQILHGHHGTLDVPAGAAQAEALSQAGSPSFCAFHRTKSRASALSYSSTSTRAPARMPLKSLCESLP